MLSEMRNKPYKSVLFLSPFPVGLTMLKTHYNKSVLFLPPFSVDLTMNQTDYNNSLWLTLCVQDGYNTECDFRENVTIPRKTIIFIYHFLQKRRQLPFFELHKLTFRKAYSYFFQLNMLFHFIQFVTSEIKRLHKKT